MLGPTKKWLWIAPLLLAVILGVSCFLARGGGAFGSVKALNNTWEIGVWDGWIYISRETMDHDPHLTSSATAFLYLLHGEAANTDDHDVRECCGITLWTQTLAGRSFTSTTSFALVPFPYIAALLGIWSLLLRMPRPWFPTVSNLADLAFKGRSRCSWLLLPPVAAVLLAAVWILSIGRQLELHADLLDDRLSARLTFHEGNITCKASHDRASTNPYVTTLLYLTASYTPYAQCTNKKPLGIHVESDLRRTSQDIEAEFVDWYPALALVLAFWCLWRRRSPNLPQGFPITAQ